MDFQAIWDEAQAAATAAQEAFMAKYGEPMYCGFAWVTVKPARGKFVNWCRTQNSTASRGMPYGSLGTYGGWQFWGPGSYRGQSMDIKEEGARAFADVLKKHGISATCGSRAD